MTGIIVTLVDCFATSLIYDTIVVSLQKAARSQVSRVLPGNALAAGGPVDRPSALLSGVSGDDDTFLSTVGPLGKCK